MLPLFPDSLAMRATIGLIDPLGLALLVGCPYQSCFAVVLYCRSISGIRCSILLYSQYLGYCLFLGLSTIMRVQHAFCYRSTLGVHCMLLPAAIQYVPCCCCAAAGAAAGSAQQQLEQPTTAVAMPATTPAAVVATILDAVLLLLSFSCAGEAISYAQAPLEVSSARRRQG